MNDLLKLAIVFTTGVVVTFLFIGVVNNAEAPTATQNEDEVIENEEAETGTSTPDDVAEDSVTTETAPTPAAPPASTYIPTYTPPPKPETVYPTHTIVSFTGKEMIPSEVVIIEGGTVTFMNSSAGTMWIASHAHPLHNAYREQSSDDCAGSTFDQCYDAPPNGMWTFKFNLPGKWYYHEEGNRLATGLVTVLTKEQFDKRY